MDTQLDKLVKEVTRCVPLQEPICIHFLNEMRAKGLRALDYKFGKAFSRLR